MSIATDTDPAESAEFIECYLFTGRFALFLAAWSLVAGINLLLEKVSQARRTAPMPHAGLRTCLLTTVLAGGGIFGLTSNASAFESVSYTHLDVYKRQMDYKSSKWVGYAALDNTLRLSRKPDLAFEFGGYYQSEAIQCTYDIGASWRLDAGVKWTFAAGKAELSVKGNDLFDSMTPVSEVDFGEQRLRMGNDFHTRNVTVNFVYRFGGYKDRERKKVDTSRFGH